VPGHLDQSAQMAFELARFHTGTLRAALWPVNRWQRLLSAGTLAAQAIMTASTPSTAHVSVGCAELPPGMNRTAYFARLDLLEMSVRGEHIPTERIVARWADEAGERGRYALVAPRWLCHFHRGDDGELAAIERAVGELARAAAGTRAAAVVFATPPDLSPSLAHRDALRRFFATAASAERFAGDDASSPTARIWQPSGLWRPTTAAAFAAELGVAAVVDPLAGDPLEEGIPPAPDDVAYARVTGLGRPSRPLGPDDLAELVEWASPSRRAFLVLATATRFQDAVLLARTIAG